MKSSVEEIRQRFDRDVERFSNLDTGQTSFLDSVIVLELVTEVAAAATPEAQTMMDIGCGAGNYSIKLLHRLPGLRITLVDLSRPMLDRALERLREAGAKEVFPIQGDIRKINLTPGSLDIIMAAAVFHHLRTEAEWRQVFAKCYAALRPGGSFWIADLVSFDHPEVQAVMWKRYGDYLSGLKGEAYRDQVFAYIEDEDTPRPLLYQLHLLKEAGFSMVEVLHQNGPFAAFGAVRSVSSH